MRRPVEQGDRETDRQGTRALPWSAMTCLVVSILVAASCGANSSTASQEGAGDADQVEVAASPTETTEPDDSEGGDETEDTVSDDAPTSETVGGNSAEGNSEAADLSGLRVVTTNAVGGLRLGVPQDVQVVHDGELIQVRHPSAAGEVIIARVSRSILGAKISTIDDLREEAEAVVPATSEPTGQTMNLLGLEMEQYIFRGDGSGEASGSFVSAVPGAGGNAVWAPTPVAELYLAEAGGGVLVAGVVAKDEADLPALNELFDRVVATLSLTGPEILAVPTQQPAPFVPFGDPPPVTPRDVDNGLPQAFSMLEPGSYDLSNLSQPLLVDVGDGWFLAPNFPGFVVLADVTNGKSGGPGDHDVVILQGTTGIHGLTALRHDASATSLQTPAEVEAFIANPPTGLRTSNIDNEAVLGGATTVRFDIEVDPDATCQEDFPCVFAFSSTDPNLAKFIESGYVNRIWWVADAPNDGGLMIAASAPGANAEWLDGRAAELIETINFG